MLFRKVNRYKQFDWLRFERSSSLGDKSLLNCNNMQEKNMGTLLRSAGTRKPNESIKIILTTFIGVLFGFFVGVFFPAFSSTKFNLYSGIVPPLNVSNFEIQQTIATQPALKASASLMENETRPSQAQQLNDSSQIWVPSNPRGAERLPPNFVASQSDLYLHRLWGKPSEDLTSTPKYLVSFTVGYAQKNNIDAAVKKFSDNFTIVLFHYDGHTTEWDVFEWSKRAIHVSAPKQTKWWYAKRFLHPDIVAPYDYIFIWDEDLGVENFNAEEYIKVVKKHGLEISQPGLEPNNKLTWEMTKKQDGQEVHKKIEQKPGKCKDPLRPPCAAFVEIMAPVFSREAWRCVWHMLQNDLVHGWGLDLSMRRCFDNAHEKIGVVDSQWVVHQSLPSLGDQGKAQDGKAAWQGVRERCRQEWFIFDARMKNAEVSYYRSIGVDPAKVKS